MTLGNLNHLGLKDGDCVVGMWKNTKNKPDDYVLSTNKYYSIRQFVEVAYKIIEDIIWNGKGLNEVDW